MGVFRRRDGRRLPSPDVTRPAERSGVGALADLFVLGRWAASRAAYVFVVIPFVTVLLSAWLDDEPVGWGLLGGGLLVLAGVYVGALRLGPSAAAEGSS